MSSYELKLKRIAKVHELNGYIRRYNAVISIYTNSSKELELNPASVNSYLNEVESKYQEGLKGKTTDLVPNIDEIRQKDIYVDVTIDSMRDNISLEKTRLKNKIESLEEEIRQLDRDIAAAEEAERRAAEEAQRNGH